MELIDWLAARQQELGFADRAFARHLGLSHKYWTLLRLRNRRLTLFVVRLAVARWPEHTQTIWGLALIPPPEKTVAREQEVAV